MDSGNRRDSQTRNAKRAPQLLKRLREIVGKRHVLTRSGAARFVTGYRYGRGDATAVVCPGSLVDAWRILQACVDEGVVVIMQAANTGLTGGSTPRDAGYDRRVVVISTMRIKGIHLVHGGRQAVCLPGSTLHELESILSPLGREPHSVIGSSCIGASVIGGICNNSGGALVRRGPAFTQMSLYARIRDDGRLELVNDLGIALGADPETIMRRLEAGEFTSEECTAPAVAQGSSSDYETRVRDIAADTPARFNADARHLHGASGSAGRIAVFAVRVDTFPAEADVQTVYVGCQDPGALAQLRRDVLAHFTSLPISGEYIHREAFDMADEYGKDTFLAIKTLGTSRLPVLFAAKARADGIAAAIGLRATNLPDIILQFAARLSPDHLPPRMRQFRDQFEHHLIIKVPEEGRQELEGYLARWSHEPGRAWFRCTAEEANAAFLHRFAVAGAAVRYLALNARRVDALVSIDVALPRNAAHWFERLPESLDRRIAVKVYYGHFFCHVFHQDYLVLKGEDPEAVEVEILATLDARGAKYPAEHNVGHHYSAEPELVEFYRSLDPGNRFNPGIGRTPAGKDWTVI